MNPPVDAHSGRVAPRLGPRPATRASTAEIIATARRWYEDELLRCELVHRDRWPDHREWVESYLTEQVRERLVARGWRSTNALV